MTKIPIACTLTTVDAHDRVEEWRSFLADHIEIETSARDANTLRLRLRPGDATLLAAADLAAREKDCCAFFTFSIAIESDGRWLHITVPPDASEILDRLAAE